MTDRSRPGHVPELEVRRAPFISAFPKRFGMRLSSIISEDGRGNYSVHGSTEAPAARSSTALRPSD
jgi:hypothetical protein